MAGKAAGPMCRLRNPQQVNDGTLCRQQSPLPGFTGRCLEQRSMMTPEEQLACPESKMEDDEVTEFVVFLFADAAMAVAKGIEKLGFRELLNVLMRKEEKNVATAIDFFDPITETFPNSPYIDKTIDPKEITENINKKIAEDLKSAIRSNKVAEENAEIEKLHQEFIRTGNWKFDGLDEGQFPDEALEALRKDYKLKHPQ